MSPLAITGGAKKARKSRTSSGAKKTGAKKDAKKTSGLKKASGVKKTTHKKSAVKKTAHKKTATKKVKTSRHKTGGAAIADPTFRKLQLEAKKLGIPLSKDGKKRTKASLARAISYRQ